MRPPGTLMTKLKQCVHCPIDSIPTATYGKKVHFAPLEAWQPEPVASVSEVLSHFHCSLTRVCQCVYLASPGPTVGYTILCLV